NEISATLQASLDPDDIFMGTYEIRLSPESYQGEMTHQIIRGIHQGLLDITESFSNLHDTVQLVCEQLPGAIKFFKKYPLRLLSMQLYNRVLAYYREDGYQLNLWYKYTPPEKVGQVELRFLEVDDRTKPNSMGFASLLFNHPLLAIPVLYHEYLHFDGKNQLDENKNGSEIDGIKNESKVWLLENLFLRFLIAKLAPEDNDSLEQYHRNIQSLFREADMLDTLQLLDMNPAEDSFREYLEKYILKLYGKAKTEEQALNEAVTKIWEHNEFIRVANKEESDWCPEKTWPILMERKDSGLLDNRLTERIDSETYNKLHEIVRSRATQINTVTSEEYKDIFQTELVQKQLEAWEGYLKRFPITPIFRL
ncbi:MAG: hypothetical protein KAR20_05215, partial [Candidatus Heimdallarchaeota archaeon]|nr:hypothetical protein [Candidatus Heimdallarchaeota archaeon]